MQCIIMYATVIYSCCLKSVLRYKFLILNTNHLDNLYLFEQGCEDPWLFFEAKRGPQAKNMGNTGLDVCMQWQNLHQYTST
jgi:hypothetical protein